MERRYIIAEFGNFTVRWLPSITAILVKTVAEFKDMNPKDVVQYIEGEPYIGVVPVEQGLTNSAGIMTTEPNLTNPASSVPIEHELTNNSENGNTRKRLVGLNTENLEINEGLIRFDIIFYVRMKDGLSKIIINIEAQKDSPTNYNILNRAIFYVSRLVSSQKERDFTNSNYDDISQVFSIWICMNMNDNIMSHIHLTKDELLEPYNWGGNLVY